MAVDSRAREIDVIEAFHDLAQRSLAQARSDGLIDAEYIASSSESDLQVLGPAITLFFAALENTSESPSVAIPATTSRPAFTLSVETCPDTFLSLFRLWSKLIQPLQALTLDQQHDVARLICDLEPISSPVSTRMIGMASDIEKIAISISQRRTFLERYTRDLQRGLADGPHTNYNAPPGYAPSQPQSQGQPRPQFQPHAKRPLPTPPSALAAAAASPDINQDDPVMASIRETLYSALAEVIATAPTLGQILQDDPVRGYFTAVALALVEAALNNVTRDGERVKVFIFDQGEAGITTIGPEDAPVLLQAFVRELLRFAGVLRSLQERDDQRAIDLAMQGQDDLGSLTMVETLKQEIELGTEASTVGDNAGLIEIRAICNSVNRMAIAITNLPGFQQRSGVFQVLKGVSPELALK